MDGLLEGVEEPRDPGPFPQTRPPPARPRKSRPAALLRYQPGFNGSHYCTHCDIFFDVNGAVHIHVPKGWLIVPVYDV